MDENVTDLFSKTIPYGLWVDSSFKLLRENYQLTLQTKFRGGKGLQVQFSKL